MKSVLVAIAGGLLIGTFAATYAKLPPPTAEEKAAAAAKKEKEAAAKAQEAKDLAQAQDKAAANYKKNKGTAPQPTAEKGASTGGASAQPQARQAPAGADHSQQVSPEKDLTRKEAQQEMPTPGQANDHSTTARETVDSQQKK